MKNIKSFFSLFLAMLILFTSSFAVTATAISDNYDTIETTENESPEELMPYLAKGCGFTSHYSDMTYWPNGNLKSVVITPLYSNGNPYGEPYTMTYPMSGEGSFKFHGCKCPACRSN